MLYNRQMNSSLYLKHQIIDILQVVSGEKEGGSKVYSIDSYYCGTLVLGIFSSPDSAHILLLTNFCFL